MVIERRIRKQIEKEAQQYRESKEGVPPSIVEILEDPVASDLLATIAQKKGNEALQGILEKIHKRETLEPKDFETLEKQRTLIKEALDKAKEVIELLKENDTIEIIANRSKVFRKIVGILGPNTRKFLERYLANLYVEDKKKFKDLEEKIKAIKDAEEALSKIKKDLQETAKRLGIPEDKLAKALEEEKPEEAIRNLVRESRGMVAKVKDWWTKGQWTEKRVEELNKVEEIDKQLEEINNNLAEIGNMIGQAVFASEKGRELLTKAIRDFEATVEEPPMSFAEAFGDLDGLNEQGLNKEFFKYYDSIKVEFGNKKFENLSNKDKKRVKSRFIEHKKKQMIQGKAGGVVGIFTNLIEQTLNALIKLS